MKDWVKSELFLLAEDQYRSFHQKLVPGDHNILGIRLPKLRKLAKDLVKKDWKRYLNEVDDEYYEEVLLQGLLIGYGTLDPKERLEYISWFVPKIDNWAVCDTFCTSLKFTNKNQQFVWDFMQPYLESDEEYQIRFAVVMMLAYYINESYIDAVLESLDQVNHDGYYVKMAVAWALSVCFVKFPDKTMSYFNSCNLDNFTFNKSLQKIVESYRVNQETKQMIRQMKRPKKSS